MRNTGLRNIDALWMGPAPNGTSQKLRISRLGDLVQVSIWNLSAHATSDWHFTIPEGFRPADQILINDVIFGDNNSTERVLLSPTDRFRILGVTGAVGIYGTVQYVTADPWPPVLPGVPA